MYFDFCRCNHYLFWFTVSDSRVGITPSMSASSRGFFFQLTCANLYHLSNEKHFADSNIPLFSPSLALSILYLIYYVGFWRRADFRWFQDPMAHMDSTFSVPSSPCPSLLPLRHCSRSLSPHHVSFSLCHCHWFWSSHSTTLQPPFHCCDQPSSEHPGTPRFPFFAFSFTLLDCYASQHIKIATCFL